VLSPDDVRAVINASEGVYNIIFRILYGSGLRLLKCLSLRIKDVDFGRGHILVRDPKGRRDRLTMLSNAVMDDLRSHIDAVRIVHMSDLADGCGAVWLPHAFARKSASAPTDWGWQWIFPVSSRYYDKVAAQERRHHLHESAVQARSSKPPSPANPEACYLPHLPPLVRHPLPRARPRHPHGPGAPRPPRRRDDNDLHARSASGSKGRAQPARSNVKRL
jgi:integrase